MLQKKIVIFNKWLDRLSMGFVQILLILTVAFSFVFLICDANEFNGLDEESYVPVEII